MIARMKMKLIGITDYGSEPKRLIFAHEPKRIPRDIPDEISFNLYNADYSFETDANNPAILDKMQIGREYYFDVSAIPQNEELPQAGE